MRLSCKLLALVLSALPCLAAEPADWIITARYVLPIDALNRVIENGAVAIRGDRIAAVGPQKELDARFTAAHRLDRGEAILMPGLIDTHTHAAMSLLRGIKDDVNLEDWLNHYIFPAESKFVSKEFVRDGTQLACLEMLLSGTTLFTDMYYFEDVVADTVKAAGMRGVLGETIIRFPVADNQTPQDALRYTEAYLRRFRNDPLIVAAVAPHALYTNSDEDLRAARTLANKYGAPLLIHLSETKKENDDVAAARHKSPTRVLSDLGVLDGRTLTAHNVWVSDGDLAILKAHGTGLAHCPSSNMMLASGAAPVVKMLALGLPVGLGPDGPAGSNNDFDMFEEMDLAAKLQKLITGDPQALGARQVLRMATIGGAQALGLDRELGSLEPGKRADLITILLNTPNAVPLYDPFSQTVYALKASNVGDVMVNGRWLVRDRRALTLDAVAIQNRARVWRDRIRTGLAVRN